jgi:hypothetical protein
MLRSRRFLVVMAGLAVLTTGCMAAPTVPEEVEEPAGPLLDGGQTLGSGHRSSGDSTAASGFDTPVAADSTTTGRGGQTLGSGH